MKLLFTIAVTLLMSIQDTKVEFTGDWKGALNIEAQNVKLPLVIKIKENEGKLSATMDSPDQGAYGLAFDKVELENGTLKLTMTQANGIYEGSMKEGKINGTWTQNGMTFDLILSKVIK